ncbi:MAG TPA: S8 family serine peptidase, partial [Verrucomicrobiae bacterium]|nr:S8 family serine peptidase [Verrucomicrobiae bacterium]
MATDARRLKLKSGGPPPHSKRLARSIHPVAADVSPLHSKPQEVRASLRRLLPILLALLALGFGLAPSARAVIAPTNTPATYIIRLGRNWSVDKTIQWLKAKPTFVYRRAFHGFALQMDTNTAAQLRQAFATVPSISIVPSPAPSIVMLNSNADPNALVKSMDLHPKFVYGAWPKPAWFKGNPFKGFALSVDAPGLAKLDNDSRVADVEPDGNVRPCDQWWTGQTNGLGIVRMGITNFPVAQINGRNEPIDVNVAVLDTGIQIDTTNLATNTVFATTIHGPHPDLTNVVEAVDFADPGYYGDDWDFHGTMMAGIIGALDNDIGVVGVAPGVRLWDVQVIGPTESAWANVLAGLDYIAQHADQIEVVNASIADSSGSTPYSAAEQAVASIVNQGTVFVAG